MKLTELFENAPDIEIRSLMADSRKKRPDSIFFCVKGMMFDGHKFIDQAVENGAVVIVYSEELEEMRDDVTYIRVKDVISTFNKVADAFYGFPSHNMTMFGITGTNGKSSISCIIRDILSAFKPTGYIGTISIEYGSVKLPPLLTTPNIDDLHGILRDMRDAGMEACALEASSIGIEQGRVQSIDFDVAVFTNLTHDHLDYHGTMTNYYLAKKQLFDNLKKDAFAVTNKDDKNGLVMTQNCKAAIHTYSTRSLADYKARILEEGFDGMLLEVNGMEVFVRLVGRFNVSNLLCIYGAAVCLGFEPAEVLRVLSTLSAVNGRFEAIHSPKGWTAIVDYAHTPDAVENVLNTINEIRKPASKVITVVGCGGNRDKGKRPMMASIAKKNSTQLILTSDNPRDEEPKDILSDMIAGLSPEEQQQTLVIEDRETAIKTACMLAGKDDVILIAGKGHEDYQIIKGVKHHFDDHEVVKANL